MRTLNYLLVLMSGALQLTVVLHRTGAVNLHQDNYQCAKIDSHEEYLNSSSMLLKYQETSTLNMGDYVSYAANQMTSIAEILSEDDEDGQNMDLVAEIEKMKETFTSITSMINNLVQDEIQEIDNFIQSQYNIIDKL